MDSKTSTDAKWDWIPCNYNLKREINGKTVFWNLSPSIVLTNPSGSGPDPNVKLFIDTEKSLQFSHELGWNWHKSWNLPNISVRLEIKDSANGEMFLSPKNLYSHLFAVKAVLDHKENFHLVDIGLRGITKIELLDGHAFFSAIKFASTSYNNEGVKFHLVLSLYIMGEDDNMPKILNSTISPPIFVDSRKSARDSQILMEKKMSSFVEPFLPENLEKIFIKRENKRKNDVEIQICNDLEGLFNYLTAPNIRHKVKHPLFLSMKFSRCVKLFYNSQTVKTQSLEELMEILQNQLCEDHKGRKSQSPPTNVSNENRMFLLLFEETGDSFKTKKIIEAVEPIQSQSFGLLYSKNQLPEHFAEISNIPEFMAIYRKNFASLFSASKIHRQSYGKDDESGDDSNENSSSESESEEDDPSKDAIPRKKLKSNKESCQNLVGIGSDSKNITVNLKDPFSVLKEKKEGLLNLSEDLEEKASNIDNIKGNALDQEEEKSPLEGDEEKVANFAKKQQNEMKNDIPMNFENLLNKAAMNSTNSNASLPAAQQPSAFNSQNTNNLPFFSLLENINNMNKNTAAANPNLMSPFANAAFLNLLASGTQNPMNLMQQQQQPQKSMNPSQGKNNQNINNLPNLPNFGMNFNNYALLNSLLMNSSGMNAPSPYDFFASLMGNPSRNNMNSGVPNNSSNKNANDMFFQMAMSNLMNKNNAFPPQNNQTNANNQQDNNNNNLMKNLLLQSLQANNPNVTAQMQALTALLNNKGGETNQNNIIKKEEDK